VLGLGQVAKARIANRSQNGHALPVVVFDHEHGPVAPERLLGALDHAELRAFAMHLDDCGREAARRPPGARSRKVVAVLRKPSLTHAARAPRGCSSRASRF
jgi:hypothetical protein